ncbi:hypothetical protein ACOMHN_019426 [Nucella lapillus]
MALVTLQRSPSPSNDPDEESAEGTEEGSDGRSGVHRKSLSESYFTVKGAALILPHSDLNRKTSRKNHGGEIQRHLQSMLYLLRPEDKIKVAIRLESQQGIEHRYMALVSTMGRQDTEECVLLGLDCAPFPLFPTPTTTTTTTPASPPSSPPSSPTTLAPPPPPPHPPGGGALASPLSEGRGGVGVGGTATIGMVLPIWMGMKIRLNGDGGFAIVLEDKSYLFKPVSVQAMWTAIHSVHRALYQAEQTKYMPEGLTHTWVEYYRSKVDHSNQTRLTAWHLMEDVEIFAPASLSYSNENEAEKMKLTISAKLKEVMMTVDLDEATCRSLRLQVEEALSMKLDQYRNYFDEELIRILGQMDAPSCILDYLYLGTEWNASNLEELQKLGIKYILNITREIDNFFTGMFHYCNVRLYDVEESELMKHWLKTYQFINKARKHNSKVLVHCKMGISRSASSVIAYLMKENQWSLDTAFAFVKERRNCIRPNKGFMEQLQTYEGILNASNKRHIFRSKSEPDMLEAVEEEEAAEGGQQGSFLGDSLFCMMNRSEWTTQALTPEEEILLRKGVDHDYTSMEPDLETDSRSADSMEEPLPDLPSPGAEQPPPTPQFHDTGPKTATSGEKIDPSQPSAPTLAPSAATLAATPAAGAPTRIKSDTSWIKLELPGESSTDPPEAMEVKDWEDPASASSDSAGKEGGEHSPPPDTPDSVFVIGGFEAEAAGGRILPPKPSLESDGSENLEEACRGSAQEKGSVSDLGIHQYYSREQIPWNPGKVRNLREGFSPCTSNAPGDGVPDAAAKSSEATSVSSSTLSAEPSEEASMESESSMVGASVGQPHDPSFSASQSVGQPHDPSVTASQSVGQPHDPSVTASQSASGEKSGTSVSSADGGQRSEEENMETDDLSRSVYELEDIQLAPGTVRRTRQEIEERQKLQGDDADGSGSGGGGKSVRRSSSLREEREVATTKDRDSERRKTCTPIVSPPQENSTEMEEEAAAEVETLTLASTLRLGHRIGESSTDDVEMVEVVGGREEGEGRRGGEVTVYTFGEECLSVKAGIVRRQKQEIENKSWEERGGSHQRSLSHGSTGSTTALDDASTDNKTLPVDPNPEAMLVCSEGGASGGRTAASSEPGGLEHAVANIPPSSHWTFPSSFSPASVEGMDSKGSRVSVMDTSGSENVFSVGVAGECGERERPTQRHSALAATRKKAERDCGVPEGSGRAFHSHSSHALEKHRHSSGPAKEEEEKEHWAEPASSRSEGTFLFRPYAHTFPSSARKPPERGQYDPETLAMIREIGSAFVSAPPPRGEEEGKGDSQGGSSMVRHLVKNIEKESKVPKPERKIVLLNSEGKKCSKASAAPPLFAPSPEFLTNIERQLSQPSPLSPSPQHPPLDSWAQPVTDPRTVPPGVCPGGAQASPSAPSAGVGEGGEHASSVVKHLRGRFEGSGFHCDRGGEEDTPEPTQSPALASQPGRQSPCAGHDGRVMMREKKPSAPFPKSRSVEEHPAGESPESLPHSPPVAASCGGGGGASMSEPSRWPRLADHAACYSSPTPRCGGSAPRVQAPWYHRDAASDLHLEAESDGVKVRKLHGKSHPLSRLQQQQEQQQQQQQHEEPSHPPSSIQRQSPFHSSM